MLYDIWDSTEQFTNRLQKWGNIKKSDVFQLNRRPFGDVESCNGGINSFPHRSWDGGGLLMYRRFGWLEFGWMVWKVWTDGVAANTQLLNQRCGFSWKAAGVHQRTTGEGVQRGLVREEPADPGPAVSVSVVCLYLSPSLMPLLSTPVLSFLILSGPLLYDYLKTLSGSLVQIASPKGQHGAQCPPRTPD